MYMIRKDNIEIVIWGFVINKVENEEMQYKNM